MNQAQFNEIIRRRIAEFWAARGRTVGPDGVNCQWPCEFVEVRQSREGLHNRVDTDPKRS